MPPDLLALALMRQLLSLVCLLLSMLVCFVGHGTDFSSTVVIVAGIPTQVSGKDRTIARKTINSWHT